MVKVKNKKKKTTKNYGDLPMTQFQRHRDFIPD